MKKILLMLVAALLIAFTAVSANAVPFNYAFAQDDFTFTFGADNDPGAPGGSFTSHGRVMSWTSPVIVAYYTLTGSNSTPLSYPLVSGFTTSTLTLYATDNSTIIWQSIFGSANMQLGGPFPAPPRPYYATAPLTYDSVGDAFYLGPANTYSITIPWFGTYNWSYIDTDQDGNIEALIGNAQARLQVPEPGTLLLLGLGMIGVLGIRRAFKK